MAVADRRLEFRIAAESKARIARAATIVDLPVGEFARTAAEEKADAIIREYEATTTVPAEFFDEMLIALDAPAHPVPALVAAMKRADDIVDRV